MANDSSNVTVLELGVGQSGDALGLTVTFQGATPVHYGGDKPPAGSVILGFAHGGAEDSAVWLDHDWGDAHAALGYTYRVLNAPELKPRTIRVEVRKGAGA